MIKIHTVPQQHDQYRCQISIEAHLYMINEDLQHSLMGIPLCFSQLAGNYVHEWNITKFESENDWHIPKHFSFILFLTLVRNVHLNIHLRILGSQVYSDQSDVLQGQALQGIWSFEFGRYENIHASSPQNKRSFDVEQ